MRSLLRLVFWSAAIFAFTMAVLPKPPEIPGEPSDKVQHILAFLVLSTLSILAYPRTSLLGIGIALSVFGVLIELVQLIPALNRDGEPMDWMADTLAVTAVLAIAWGIRRERQGGT